jgi:hypothetical protein
MEFCLTPTVASRGRSGHQSDSLHFDFGSTIMDEKPPYGLCVHEAGHALVGSSFRLLVVSVWVNFTEEKGWHGEADFPKGDPEKLPLDNQLAIRLAGEAAQEVYGYPVNWDIARDDREKALNLLFEADIRDERVLPMITEAKSRITPFLETHRLKALRLADRLAECGHIDHDEFQANRFGAYDPE